MMTNTPKIIDVVQLLQLKFDPSKMKIYQLYVAV